VGNASVGFGSEVCVPVTIEGFKDIIGLQFKRVMKPHKNHSQSKNQ